MRFFPTRRKYPALVIFVTMIACITVRLERVFCGQLVAAKADQGVQQEPTVANQSPETQNEKLPKESRQVQRKYEHKKFTNVSYANSDNYALLCDVYIPEGTGPFPAVLAIHGGAWRQGSKILMLRHAWKLAGAGYVVVAINYRHAPQYKFPAQVHDCKQAVRWIRTKSERLKVNTDQIAVFGYSAGGHLGAMLGVTDVDDGLEGAVSKDQQQISSRVQCVVVGGGPCEFEWINSSALTHWLGETRQENPEIYRIAAPLTFVTKDDPPFIFFHGGDDQVVPPDSSRKMHEQLKSVGIDSEYRIVADKGHFATFSDTTWLDEAIAFMDEKLNRTHHE